MSLRYTILRQKPTIFKAMSGLTVALFDELVWELEPAYAEATVTRRTRPGRERAVCTLRRERNGHRGVRARNEGQDAGRWCPPATP